MNINGPRKKARKNKMRQRMEAEFNMNRSSQGITPEMIMAAEAQNKEMQKPSSQRVEEIKNSMESMKEGLSRGVDPDSEKDPNAAGWEEIGSDKDYEFPANFDQMGLRFTNTMRAIAKVSIEDQTRKPNMERVVSTISDTYGDKFTANYLARSLETSKPEKGGMFVVPQIFQQEFQAYEFCFSPVMALGVQSIPMPPGGGIIHGVRNPAEAKWKGEKCEMPASKMDFEGQKFNSKQAEVKMCISECLLDSPVYNVASIARNHMLGALSQLTSWSITEGRGTEHSPLGIFNHPDIGRYSMLDTSVTPNVPEEVSRSLVKRLMAHLMANKSNLDPSTNGFLLGPQTWFKFSDLVYELTGTPVFPDMENGMLGGFPYSTFPLQGAYDTVDISGTEYELHRFIFGDWSKVYVARDSATARFRISDEASFLDANGNTCSAFDADAVVMKYSIKQDSQIVDPDKLCIVEGITCEAFKKKGE